MASKQAEFIWFNGEVMPWANAQVHAFSHAIHYGSSVFEGVRAYNTPKGPAVFRHQEHTKRLFDSAKIYRINVGYTQQEIMEATREILRRNNLSNAYIRPAVFLGDIGMGLRADPNAVAEVVIGAFEWDSFLGPESFETGVDVGVSSWQRLAPNTIPTGAKAGGNYLSSQLIAGEAGRHGYAEGIALDVHGQISEGSGENIFVVRDGVLYTPPVTAGILPGITRSTLMTLAAELGFEVRVEPMAREALYLADEIFMCGTAAEIVPVRSVDGIQVGIGKCGPMTKQLQQAYFGVFNGETEDKWGWLDYINP